MNRDRQARAVLRLIRDPKHAGKACLAMLAIVLGVIAAAMLFLTSMVLFIHFSVASVGLALALWLLILAIWINVRSGLHALLVRAYIVRREFADPSDRSSQLAATLIIGGIAITVLLTVHFLAAAPGVESALLANMWFEAFCWVSAIGVLLITVLAVDDVRLRDVDRSIKGWPHSTSR